jgi:hypothetical protein
VGYKLRREIEDLFPGPCTPAERIAALTIADTARESSRVSLIPHAVLCARCGLTPQALKKALQRLSARGLEFRISHGKGRDGRDVYTKPGAEIEYRVPSVDEFGHAYKTLNGGTPVPPCLPDGPWLPAVDKPP